MSIVKKIAIVLLALFCLLALAGCCFEHEWEAANCTSPMTCVSCGKTEGAPLGHTWDAATCVAAKTCQICGSTEGEPLGHTWQDATCIVPKKCAICHMTEGEPLSHTWEDATTEAPKTCTGCGQTDGKKIDTDPRFTTASTKQLYGKWQSEVVLTGEMLGLEDYFDEIPVTLYYEFCNDGNLIADVEIEDRFAFLDGMKKAVTDVTYAEFAALGVTKAQADQAIQAEYGITMEQYVDAAVESIDKDEIFGAMTADLVYYVGPSGELYTAMSWYDAFEGSAYTLENGILIIEEDTLEEGGEPLQWKRVEE